MGDYMKRRVYQSAEGKHVKMEVLARYKFVGEDAGISLTKGVIYDCVGYDKELGLIRIVDDTGEDYLFKLDNFELIEDFRKDII